MYIPHLSESKRTKNQITFYQHIGLETVNLLIYTRVYTVKCKCASVPATLNASQSNLKEQLGLSIKVLVIKLISGNNEHTKSHTRELRRKPTLHLRVKLLWPNFVVDQVFNIPFHIPTKKL